MSSKAFDLFREKLRLGEWMTNPDGEDLCSSCWEKYLELFNDNLEHKQGVIADSHPTAKVRIAKSRKSADGWHVQCERLECGASVFVPFRLE